MKIVFVLKTTVDGKFGYFDGATNWSAHIYEAKQYTTYPEAEAGLKHLIENVGCGGFMQIEKYFTNL
jgi:hypothetical protein